VTTSVFTPRQRCPVTLNELPKILS
jgi:hypothetical protein